MQKYKTKSLFTTFFTALIALPVLLTGCAAQSSASPASGRTLSPSNELISSGQASDAQLFYQVLIGELGYTERNYNDAYILILNAARQSHDDKLYERAVVVALQAKATGSALSAAREWLAAKPASRDASRYILDILLSSRQFNQIIEPAQTIIRLTPDEERPEFITALGQYLSPYAQHIEPFYETLLSPWLNSSHPSEVMASWVSVALLKLSASKLDEAYSAIEKAHAIDPQAIEPVLAAITLIDKSIPQAQELVQNYLQDESANPLVRLSYVQTLLQQQRINPAMQNLEIAIRHPDTPPIAWFILGSLQLETKQLESGMQTLKVYLDKTESDFTPETRSNRERALLELAQTEVDLNHIEAAQQWLDQVSDPTLKIPALKSYIAMLVESERFDTALNIASQLPDESIDERTEKTIIQAQILMQAQRWQNAYNLLNTATSNTATPNEDMLYLQAIAAQKLKRFTQMESLLRRIIAINPSHINAYNTLGYILADRNERLSEAKSLIEKALALEPDNPMIIDSLGWVEYRLGNHRKALELLEAAYNDFPDSEVAAHLGEVQWVLGQRDAALTTWKLALLSTPDSTEIRDTLTRLRVSRATVDNFTLPAQALTPATPSSEAPAHNAATYIEYLIANKQWQPLYDLLAPVTAQTRNPDLMQLQAYVSSELGRLDEAETLLRQVIESHPENAMVYNDLGYMLTVHTDRLDEAKALIEKALALAPENAAIFDSMGWVEFKLGNIDTAIEWLQRAYDLDPTIAETGIHLGEALWHTDRKAEAILVWKDVRFRHPDLPELQETLDRLNVTLP